MALAEAGELALKRRQAACPAVQDYVRSMTTMIAADQVSYEDLYARWEHGNWRKHSLTLRLAGPSWSGRH